jgi:hypothetical protein
MFKELVPVLRNRAVLNPVRAAWAAEACGKDCVHISGLRKLRAVTVGP